MTLEELEQLAESGFTAGKWEQTSRLVTFREADGSLSELGRFQSRGDAKLAAAAPSLLATAIAAKKREKEIIEMLRELEDAFCLSEDYTDGDYAKHVKFNARDLVKRLNNE